MVVITTNGGLQPWAIQGSLLRALKDVPAVSHSRGEIAGAVSFLGLGTANIRRLQFQIRRSWEEREGWMSQGEELICGKFMGLQGLSGKHGHAVRGLSV